MTRFVPVFAIVALLAAAPTAQQTPVIRGGVHTVPVYASVVDATGRMVTDLKKDDFLVLDNGKPQELSVFTSDRQPITIVVMLDRSGSVKQQYDQVRAAAEQFVANLGESDRARIGSFSTAVRIDPITFTSDRNELVRILHDDLLSSGPTPLWNATSEAMKALTAETGRRVVLMFTDGYDNPMSTGPNTTYHEIHERSRNDEIMIYGIGLTTQCAPSATVAAAAETSSSSSMSRFFGALSGGAPLLQRRAGPGGRGGMGRTGFGRGRQLPGRVGGGGFPPIPIIPRPGLPAPPPPKRPGIDDPYKGSGLRPKSDAPCVATPDPNLREVAIDSGGGYFELHTTDELGRTFARVADELHRQYLLGFTPAAFDGQVHTLEVRLRGPNLTVRARRTYLAVAK